MIELTIDSTALVTTSIPLFKPCRAAATHAGRKQIDCQGSAPSRSGLSVGLPPALAIPSLAQRQIGSTSARQSDLIGAPEPMSIEAVLAPRRTGGRCA